MLDTSDDDVTDTLDLVDTRDGHSEWLLGWSLWDVDDAVQSVEKSLSENFLLLWLHGESAIPRHAGGFLDEVISLEARHWNKRNLLGLETQNKMLEDLKNFRLLLEYST